MASTNPGAVHLIELSFDFDLVQDIKSLNSNLKGIGKLLNQHSHSESVRLLRLIQKYWTDEPSLTSALGAFFSSSAYDARIQEMLFDYEKDGFPWAYKDDLNKRALFLQAASTSFNKANFDNLKLNWKLDSLQRAACFIIYRFRCSIAHASIGEHIISLHDDSFVSEKAEPLIQAFINNMYS